MLHLSFSLFLLALGASGSASSQASSFDLSALNGTNAGLRYEGFEPYDITGTAVHLGGDINGDGIDDYVFGAPNAKNENGDVHAGKIYVVFGKTAPFNVSTSLDGTNGFVLTGAGQQDGAGHAVTSGGDVNGDGVQDLVIGAPYAKTPNSPQERPGQVYVIFGRRDGFPPQLSLEGLDGTNGGYTIHGIHDRDTAGAVVAMGNVNGDKYDDIIISAPSADPNGNKSAGQVYVVFGKDTPSSVNLSELDGNNGLLLNGINPYDHAGMSVASGGDLNDDTIEDLVIGAAGQVYVLYGRDGGSPEQFNLTDVGGSNGFIISGDDSAGASVALGGDVNGDDIVDLVIGVPGGEGINETGKVYVLFGPTSGFPDQFNLTDLNGGNGYVMNGIAFDDYTGQQVSSGGDVNGDGINDILISAPGADPNQGNLLNAGKVYVVFGSNTTQVSSLAALDGSNGFTVNGKDKFDGYFSISSGGDLNNDTLADILIGAPHAGGFAGEVYVIYGNTTLPPASSSSFGNRDLAMKQQQHLRKGHSKQN